ncbi:MAG: hydrogenase maturation protease [Planctomycetota bacterium]|jgi:hydrogenase maturation protease
MILETGHSKVAIVGLGNELMTDDGVGVHVVRELQKAPPAGVLVAEVGTRALNAQQLLEEADIVIVIDAVCADGRPGSIYLFDSVNVETQRHYSLHEMGIIGVMRLIQKDARPKLIILGVEPEIIDYGMELSETVRAALKPVVGAARKIADQIRRTEFSNINIDSLCPELK